MSRASWYSNVVIIFCAFCLLTSGCVTQPPNKNVSLPSIYTAPIGGFETTWAGIVEPNTIFETDYIFYSRNWGPGEVKYTLMGSFIDKQFFSDPLLFHIDPSSFTAEPGQIYKSHVFLNTSHIPDYKAPDISRRDGKYPVRLYVNVSLEDNSSSFGDDEMFFVSPGKGTSGPYTHNWFSVDNCSIVVKRGETRTFNTSFIEDSRGVIGKISFISLNTPLNFTISPSEYIARHDLEFPSVVSIAADPSLAKGQYPLNIAINGTGSETWVNCGDTEAHAQFGPGIVRDIFSFNVTVV